MDYKLKISCLNQNTDLLLPISGPRLKTNDKGEEIELYDTKNFSMFLSNMGGKESVEDLKNFSFHEKVTLSFLIFNNELKSEIENNIADFLFLQILETDNQKALEVFIFIRMINILKNPLLNFHLVPIMLKINP